MEERLAFDVGMTDNQYYGIIKMICAIVRNCETKEKALEEIYALLRESDIPRETKSKKD